jgi:dTDP-4-amino-4,6-dideoxygalactose transaminase
MTIPFIDLAAQRDRLDGGIERAVERVIRSGAFIDGPEVDLLEEELSRRSGGGHVVACSSGTDALVMSLLALGVGPGDAVFVPSFTFVGTAEAVVLIGATPVFVDVRSDTFNLSVESFVEVARTGVPSGLRPVGVIAVDLFGQPAEYSRLRSEAAEMGVWVMADAAQSFGASADDRPVGSLAEVTTTSFYPAKPLGCYGDGGAIVVSDAELASRLRSLRSHGAGGHRYEHTRIGLNGRLDTIQAAVLLEKLKIFDEELVARRQVASRYDEALRDVVTVPTVLNGLSSTWAQYTIRVDRRDDVAAALGERGIPTAIHYPVPIHRQPAYSSFATESHLGVSEVVSSTVLSLPMHPYLTSVVQDRIIDGVCSAVGG